MGFDISTWMMIFFIVFLVIGMWKVYAFLPNKALADDDTTKEAQEKLEAIILKIIKSKNNDLSRDELFELVKNDEDFDKEHFWRFNQNRLNQLLNTLNVKGLVSI
ncbi:MAG: hypothetical protein L3I99_04590 [Sulfurimonas sp.]|nr:hypothetical protein [Sulfurimonas sp.]